MAYTTQAGRVIAVIKKQTQKQVRRESLRKLGLTPDALLARLQVDRTLALRYFGALQALTAGIEQHTNPNHNRRLRKQYEITARQQRKDDKEYKRAIAGRNFHASEPFDSIELDEGRACFGGRC